MDDAFVGLGIFLIIISVGLVGAMVVMNKTINMMTSKQPKVKQSKYKEHV